MRRFILNQKKQKQMGILTGSILSVFILVAILNQKIVSQNQLIQAQLEQKQTRGIASIGSLANESFNKAMQEKLLADIKKSMNENPVLYGQKPSKKDQFLQSKLGGHYSLEEKNGELHLRSTAEQKYSVESMNQFAIDFVANMLNADFEELKVISSDDQFASYQVKTKSGDLKTIDIRLDDQKHLESISLQ